jgi:hypothetical protein
MTDTTTSTALSRSPSHVAYHVRDAGAGKKGFWNRVGVAWTNRDGGFTVQLDAVPLDGRIVCQPADKPTA